MQDRPFGTDAELNAIYHETKRLLEDQKLAAIPRPRISPESSHVLLHLDQLTGAIRGMLVPRFTRLDGQLDVSTNESIVAVLGKIVQVKAVRFDNKTNPHYATFDKSGTFIFIGLDAGYAYNLTIELLPRNDLQGAFWKGIF